MAYVGKIEELLIGREGRLAMRTVNDFLDESMFPDRFIVEHCTGLNDKNSKEIYEGDILQAEHFSYTGTYGLVVIKFGEYVDTGFLDDSNYEAQGVGFHAYLTKVKETCGIQKDMMQGMVVIGNIHENPELARRER